MVKREKIRKERIRFKKGINRILIPKFVVPELKEIAKKEIEKFLEKYEINKNAVIGFEYNGGDLQDIVIYRKDFKYLDSFIKANK